MRNSRLAITGCVAAFAISCLVPTSPLAAQGHFDTERSHPGLRQRCVALRNVPLDNPATYRGILLQLSGCDETGPEVLLRAWRAVPPDTGRLSTLTAMTRRLPDDRLANMLIPLAQDRSLTPLQRSAAVATLESILLGWGVPVYRTGEAGIAGGITFYSKAPTHFEPSPVAEPVRTTTRERAMKMFRTMARDRTEEKLLRWTAGSILVAAGEKPDRE